MIDKFCHFLTIDLFFNTSSSFFLFVLFLLSSFLSFICIVGDTAKWHTPTFRVRMIFRDNRVWSLPIFRNHDCYAFLSGISNYFCCTSDLSSYSNVWCFHLIVLLRNMQQITKELHDMFFRSAKTRVLIKAWSPVRRSRFLKAGFDELTITKITRKVNAPNIRRLKSARTVVVNSSNPAHSARDLRTGDHACLTRASTGKTNLLGQMKWQDSTKVIITQKLHRIRNWEFQNMWNGMCTIEMIENLQIENSTKMWMCAISPYERRYV